MLDLISTWQLPKLFAMKLGTKLGMGFSTKLVKPQVRADMKQRYSNIVPVTEFCTNNCDSICQPFGKKSAGDLRPIN